MSTQSKSKPIPQALDTKSKVVTFDFSAQGGAIGSINTGLYVPANAHVTRFYVEKATAFTSGGSATVAFSMASAGDLMAATAYSNAVFTANIGTGIPTGTPATFVKNTSGTEKQITLDIATAALTAGKYNLHLEYK